MNSSLSSSSEELIGFPGIYRTSSEDRSQLSQAYDSNMYALPSFTPSSVVPRESQSQTRSTLPGFNLTGTASFGRQYYSGQTSPSQSLFVQTQSGHAARDRSESVTPVTPINPRSLQASSWNLPANVYQGQKSVGGISGLTSRSNSTSAFGRAPLGGPFNGSGPDPLGVSALVLDDSESIDKEGALAAQLQRAELEARVLKEEVRKLTRVLQETQQIEEKDESFYADPAVEQAYETMCKTLEVRDETIAEITLKIEAIMAAIVHGSARRCTKSSAKGQASDVEASAHRLVTRISTLKDENSLLSVSIKGVSEIEY